MIKKRFPRPLKRKKGIKKRIRQVKPRNKLKIMNKRRMTCGRSGSGKSTLIANWITENFLMKGTFKIRPEYKNRIKFMVVQPTFKDNTLYEDFPYLKKLFLSKTNSELFFEWNEATGQRILKVLKECKGKKQVIILLDDLGGDKKTKVGPASEAVRMLATSIRHYGGYLISLWQRFMNAHIDLRENVDILDLFMTHNIKELRLIHERFFGDKFSFPEFKNWLKRTLPNPFDALTLEFLNGGKEVYYLNGKKIQNTALNSI